MGTQLGQSVVYQVLPYLTVQVMIKAILYEANQSPAVI
jgi:hypothetical protein